MSSMYDHGLGRRDANYEALTPVDFIARAAEVYGDRLAVVHGKVRRNWRQTYERAQRLAGALAQAGIKRGDTVAVMLPNIPAMVEAHFGVPMLGAVLNTLNTRLDTPSVLFMLGHGEARALIIDTEYAELAQRARAEFPHLAVISVHDLDGAPAALPGATDYEAFLAAAPATFDWQPPADEWDAIALNYTSGTTGDPKGVVYHYRGAYLNAVSNILEWDMPKHPVYLWTLPLFHCNGWCFAWTVAARAGVNVCLRKFDPKTVFDLIRAEGVTHALRRAHRAERAGQRAGRAARRHHAHGPHHGRRRRARALRDRQDEGNRLRADPRLRPDRGLRPRRRLRPPGILGHAGRRRARPAQRAPGRALSPAGRRVGTRSRNHARSPGRRADRGRDHVPRQHLHEGLPEERARHRGRFRRRLVPHGDLGVMTPDGYIRIKDRSKDIIISGGENISSIEVEDALYRHPSVAAVAVVAMPDPKWGETPCAFVELKPGCSATAEEIIAHCKLLLPGFKVPRAVRFGELPKTSTGKIQKFELRAAVGATSAIDLSGPAADPSKSA